MLAAQSACQKSTILLRLVENRSTHLRACVSNLLPCNHLCDRTVRGRHVRKLIIDQKSSSAREEDCSTYFRACFSYRVLRESALMPHCLQAPSKQPQTFYLNDSSRVSEFSIHFLSIYHLFKWQFIETSYIGDVVSLIPNGVAEKVTSPPPFLQKGSGQSQVRLRPLMRPILLRHTLDSF